MLERIQQFFQAAVAKLTSMAEPVAFDPARRKALGGMAASTAAAATNASAEIVPEGYTAEYWERLTEALKKLESARCNVSLEAAKPADLVTELKESEVRMLKDSPQTRRTLLNYRGTDSKKMVDEFRACHEKVVELLGGREVPVSALPVNPLGNYYDEGKPAVLSESSLARYLPKDGFDSIRHTSEIAQKSMDRQMDAQLRLWNALEERCRKDELHHYQARYIYDSIVGQPGIKSGTDFERHVRRYVEEPGALNAAIKKEKVAKRTQEKKYYRETRTLSRKDIAELSHIFGGLEFVQDPLSLKVYAVVDAAKAETAAAIAGICRHLAMQVDSRSYDFQLSAKERAGPLPIEADLFVAYDKKPPFNRVESSAGTDLYLTLKPHQAKAILSVFNKNYNQLKNGAQSSLGDCFMELFDYGRKQARHVGGVPVNWKERLDGLKDTRIGR